MKKNILFVLIICLLLSISAVFADDFTDVMQAGVLRFGHHMDYAPFVYTDQNGSMTGIDVAMMEEVARRMGVSLQTVPLAWDGIIDALNFGQADVIGGGLSRTDERAGQIDFTRTYLTGQAVFICLNGYYKPDQITLHNFYQAKIGVEKGSNFEKWIHTYLVKPGFVQQNDVYAYGSISDVMKALNNAAVNLVILDQDLYESLYKDTGKYKIFYDGFQTEEYAYGLRTGSTITPVINSYLTAMINDGTAQAIANRFFSSDLNESQISRPQNTQPAAVSTAAAVPTASASGSCYNGMAFVADVSVTDGKSLNPGETFRKTWQIKNSGTCVWTKNYRIEPVSGTNMGNSGFQFPLDVQPGGVVEIYADMIAPSAPGTYTANWQMRSPQGAYFGDNLLVNISVNGDSQQDGQTRVIPVINYFYADSYEGTMGDGTTVYWSVDKAGGIDIYVDGSHLERRTEASGSAPVNAAIQSPGVHEIKLIAHSVTDDATETIWYSMKGDNNDGQQQVIPEIDYFYADPDSGFSGDATVVYWSASNAIGVTIYVDGYNIIDGPAEGSYQLQAPIQGEGLHEIKLVAHSLTDDDYDTTYFTMFYDPSYGGGFEEGDYYDSEN